uniref:Uncharacterized protein n=1 Tax=Anguilla anguilla TaxID=7936 RepID=A0A0E9WDC1_ANGAN
MTLKITGYELGLITRKLTTGRQINSK